MDAMTYRVGSVPFSSATMETAVEWLVASSYAGGADNGPGVSVRLANAYCVALASRDESYGNLLRDSGVNFPDGTPVWGVMNLMSKFQSDEDEPGRVRGPSFFRNCLDVGRNKNLRHYFLGGTDESMSKMLVEIRNSYPGILIAGSHAPLFGPVDEAFIADNSARIAEAKPDVVWVGLGTPKQDFATTMLAASTGRNCVGVGAAFDFVGGVVPEAPSIFQRSGTEWLFRLFSDPKRLWKRYTMGNFHFASAVLGDLFVKTKQPLAKSGEPSRLLK